MLSALQVPGGAPRPPRPPRPTVTPTHDPRHDHRPRVTRHTRSTSDPPLPGPRLATVARALVDTPRHP